MDARKLIFRFGAFEFNSSSGELSKRGLRLHLQGQPVAILQLLLNQPGDLVERKTFQQLLWPEDTFVDFERGLNADVTRLRVALRDSASRPRFIETVPRRGYRWIAPIEREHPVGAINVTRLLVLPFEQLQPDAGTAFLCFSLSDAIASSLAGLKSLVVRLGRMTPKPPADADAVLTGTLLRSGEQIRVAAQLLEVPSGIVIWTHVAQIPMGEIFSVQDQLAQRITASLLPNVEIRQAGERKKDIPATARAFEFYLRANHLSTQMRDLMLARDMYRKCLEEDPHYAPAWARLARCYQILSKFRADAEHNSGLAEAAFQRAFQLNPHLPGIHGLYAIHQTDQGHSVKAMTRLLGLLQQNRNDPDLYVGLVYCCRYAGLLNESVAAHELARSLDTNIRTSVMNTFFVMGQYQMALDHSTDNVGFMEAMALADLGRQEEALERVRSKERLPPLMVKWLAMLEKYLEGQTDEAVALILEMNIEGTDPEGFFYRARLLARLERLPEALTTLAHSLEAGYNWSTIGKQDCYLRPLQKDVRFQQLLKAGSIRSSQAKSAFAAADGPRLLKLETTLARTYHKKLVTGH